MEWQQQRARRGGRAGGNRSGAEPSAEERDILSHLRRILAPQARGTQARRPEWQCPVCTTMNFMDRTHCRASSCRACQPARRAQPPSQNRQAGAGVPSVPPPAAELRPHATQPKVPTRVQQLERALATARSGGAAAAVLEGLAADLKTAKAEQTSMAPHAAGGQRRIAPEQRLADAEAGAVVLDEAAARLKEAGHSERAAAMEAEAADLRKGAGALPPPGRRLDLQEGFVSRAEGRCSRADAAVLEAERVLEEARKTQSALRKELEDGKADLQRLRAELAAAQAAPEMSVGAAAVAAAADAEAIAVGQQASDALAKARSVMQSGEGTAFTLGVFCLPEAPGTSIFAGRAAPALDAPLDQSTAFFVQDVLQSRIREAALATARAAAAASLAAPVVGSPAAASSVAPAPSA